MAVPVAEEKDAGERRVLQKKPGCRPGPGEAASSGSRMEELTERRVERPEGQATFFF